MSNVPDGPPTVCDLYSGLTDPERKFLSDEFVLSRSIPASLDFLRSVPYPLAEDTAGAVAGIVRRYVYPLADLRTRYLPYWVFKQLRGEEGITALPLDGEQFGEDVAECFSDPEDLRDYREGIDFSNGLAGIRDEEFVARCNLVEETVKAAAEGELCAGFTVPLPLPFGSSSLTRIPLVEGYWIDRRVVELAEWGGELDRAGYRRLSAFDPHPLAWHRIYPHGTDWTNPREAEHAEVAELRQQSATRLNRYWGRTQEIDGHTHLHIEDYDAWEPRLVLGDLMTRRTKGVVVEGWNSWIEKVSHESEESEEKWIDLHGEIVGKFEHPVPWREGSDYIFAPSTTLASAERLRAAALSEWRELAFDRVVRINPSELFTEVQGTILQALREKSGQTADELKKTTGYSRSRLYQPGGIKELMQRDPPLVILGPEGRGYALATVKPADSER